MNTSSEFGTQVGLGGVPATTYMPGRDGGRMTYSVLPYNPQRGVLLQVTDGTLTLLNRPPTLKYGGYCDGVDDDLIVIWGPLKDLYKAISVVEYTTKDKTYIYRFVVFNAPPKIHTP